MSGIETISGVHRTFAGGSPLSTAMSIFGGGTPDEVNTANNIIQCDIITLDQLLAAGVDVQEYVIDLEEEVEDLKFRQEEENKRLKEKHDELLSLYNKVNSKEGTEDDQKALNEMLVDYNNDSSQSNSKFNAEKTIINNTKEYTVKKYNETLQIGKAYGQLSIDYGTSLMQTHVSSGVFNKLTGKSDRQQMIVDAGTELVNRGLVVNVGVANLEEINEQIKEIK